ncbi:bacteriohemerythrin [uncultured Thermanaerothrix sp.]|uniref:bacteriohemerythrin n=1 Tax=uncultured Thermanaerothrix sp. TaxID=1195149 RepID=UPI002605711B|nr:bacteriohemerythrin [uncultured Thermanaerothrix sp.]
MFEWKPIYSIGVAQYDEQHKRLFTIAQTLYDAMSAGQGRVVLNEIFDELIDYTRTHFASEEALMTRYAYPDYETHRLQHEDLTRQVVELRDKYRNGQIALSITVMNFLKDWLRNHIYESDKRYGQFLNQKGVR